MLAIINHSTDPKYNLALEEYALKYIDTDEDILILWQNQKSIIIGRNQNVFEEVNFNFVHQYNIPIIRRISGGGAVYHDLGNLNYSFITSHLKDNLSNYKKFTAPVIEFLNKLGVKAEFYGKSDIKVFGQKISGNAQSYHKNRMLHHGTLLFESNLEHLKLALKPKDDSFNSKSVKSNRSDVTNIRPLLKYDLSIDSFKMLLYQELLKTDDIKKYIIPMTDQDKLKINTLILEKYDLKSWNIGESPSFKKYIQLENQITIEFTIDSGLVTHLKFDGNITKDEEKAVSDIFMNTEFDMQLLLHKIQISKNQNNTTFNLNHIVDVLFK